MCRWCVYLCHFNLVCYFDLKYSWEGISKTRMRKLDHREKKLLRKTDLYGWTNEANKNEAKIVSMYRLEDKEDYQRYNKICGMITKLSHMLKTLKPDDKFRIQISEQLLDKLHQVGVVSKKNSLQDCANLPVADRKST